MPMEQRKRKAREKMDQENKKSQKFEKAKSQASLLQFFKKTTTELYGTWNITIQMNTDVKMTNNYSSTESQVLSQQNKLKTFAVAKLLQL